MQKTCVIIEYMCYICIKSGNMLIINVVRNENVDTHNIEFER